MDAKIQVFDHEWQGRRTVLKRFPAAQRRMADNERDFYLEHDRGASIVRMYYNNFDYTAPFLDLCVEQGVCTLFELINRYRVNYVRPEGRTGDYLQDFPTRFPPWFGKAPLISPLRQIFRNIISGVIYLQEQKKIHKNLMPTNIMIFEESGGLWARLSDFTSCSTFNPKARAIGGTKGWRAPEQLKDSGLENKNLDLFGLGLIIFFCLTGNHAFGNMDDLDSCEGRVLANSLDILHSALSPEARSLITRLLAPVPHNRIDASIIPAHPLFWGAHKRLMFLCTAREAFRNLTYEPAASVQLQGRRVVWNDRTWNFDLPKEFFKRMNVNLDYLTKNTGHLVRFIRNAFVHIDEYQMYIPGTTPTVVDGYFTTRYPRLVARVYEVVERHYRHRDDMKIFFSYGE